jgi:hypothetical protein
MFAVVEDQIRSLEINADSIRIGPVAEATPRRAGPYFCSGSFARVL